ncbi:MAG: adenylate/guanylate cyclase domain-containing protein [Saprospiraceae bacterium]
MMKLFFQIAIFLSPFVLLSQTGDAVGDNILQANEKRKTELANELQNGLAKLRVGQKNGDNETMLSACLEIAALFAKEQYHEKALVYLEQAVSIANELGQDEQRLVILSKIAKSLFENGKWEEAYNASEETFEQHQIFGQFGPAVEDLERMAESAINLNNFVKAREHYVKIMEMGKITGDSLVEMTAMNNMGFTACQIGNYKEAIHYFDLSEQIAKRNSTNIPGHIYTNLGIAWHNVNDKSRALRNLKLAEKKDAEQKSYIQHLISSIYLTDNDIYNALSYNEAAIREADKTKDMNIMSDAYLTASNIYQQLYEYDKALDFYKKHLALKDSLERVELTELKEMENIHAFLDDTETNFRQNQIESELKQSTLEQAELQSQKYKLEAEQEKQARERERQQQQIALLEKDKVAKEYSIRAAQLEAERVRQDLILATQNNLALKREQEIEALRQKQQLDSLDAVRRQEEQQQRIALMKSQQEIALKEQEQAEFKKRINSWAALGIVILALITGSWLYGKKLNRELAEQNVKIETQNKEIISERNRAEGLLLNILPAAIAYELKEKGAATPKHYDAVSVLFTDFEGFTAIAATMPPEEVVKELNECFMKFDEIAEKYHLEKIKTIGDSYMCAGGLPVKNNTHPFDAVSAGKEILAYIDQRNERLQAQGKKPWPIRIGIHTGELVAGVVGKRKFAYDIWGDTVNVASRMETNSESGHINISEATYKLVSEKFHCHYRGELEVKNKGKMSMYTVDD